MSKCNSNENDHGDSFDKNNLKSTLDKKNVSGNVNITINQFNEKGTCEQKPLQPNGKISVVWFTKKYKYVFLIISYSQLIAVNEDILRNGVENSVSKWNLFLNWKLNLIYEQAVDVYKLLKLMTCRKNHMCLKRELCKL